MNNTVKTMMALSGDKNVVVVRKAFVKFTNSIEAAIMLSQLLYWTERSKTGWIAKSEEEFSEELCISGYGVRKASKILRELGIIDIKIDQFKGAPTNHYFLKVDKLEESWSRWIQRNDPLISTKRSVDFNETITETTTETTTKKNINTLIVSDDDLDNFEEEEELSDNSHELSPAIAEQKILFSFGEKKNGNDAKLNTQQIIQTPSPKSSELSPTTPGGILLFAKLSSEAHAKGRKSPKSFASIAQRDAFLEVEERLTINQLEQAIDNALRNEITARRNIINYLSKYKARSVHAPVLGYKHTTIVNEDGSVYF